MNVYGLDRFAPHVRGVLGPKVTFMGMLENWLWQWSVRSHTDYLVRYEVNIDMRNGIVECSCYHAEGRLNKYRPTFFRACKHVDDVINEATRILERRNEL